MKRIIDVSFSLFALVLISPLFILIGLLVRTTSRGPVIYRGARVGQNGREFRILKFRSMIPNAESVGGSATANDDPRLTAIGAFLRRYKLDELPQLLNVLLGDMSFVGPRPEVRKFVELYTSEQRQVLCLRPGITDWASIWNSDEGAVLAGSSDPEAEYERVILPLKLDLQLRYLKTRNTFTDLKIIFYTFIKLCRKRWVPRELAGYDALLNCRKENKVNANLLRAPAD